MRRLIMLSGLQGTGKSTIASSLATKLQYPLFAKDHLESVLYNDNLTDGSSLTSYHMMFELAQLHLSLGMSCILDAVFPLVGFRNHVQDIAKSYQTQLYILHTYCSDQALHRQRIAMRLSTVPWQRITWNDTLQTQSMYVEWSREEALFLDAVNPLETNIKKVLQYIHDLT